MWVKHNLEIWETWDVIGSILRFSHVRNPGIAFGISVGDYGMLIAFLSFAATIVIAYLHWQERNNHPLIVNGLGFILGGAIGNLIDRSYIFILSHSSMFTTPRFIYIKVYESYTININPYI